LVVVFDDLHWGEPVFLDLVEHIADFSRDAPILLLCMARPELLDRRSAWGGGKLNASNVLLEPLSSDETQQLIERLPAGAKIDAGLRERILEAAGGNPLFVGEMLAMLADRSDGNGSAEIAVPRPFRRCPRRRSTSSTMPSAVCWSEAPLRVMCSTAARWLGWRPRK